jgi:hypothetical protein
MSPRTVVAVAVALALAPVLASADKAQRRGGSSGSTAGASSRQPSSSSSKTGSSSRKTGSSSSLTKTGRSSSGARSSASRPPATAAQRRQPRPGTGSGTFDAYDGYGYRPYRPYYPYGYGYGYGYRYSYSPFYSPFYSPGYRYGFSWSVPFYSGPHTSAPSYSAPEDDGEFGSMRVLVRPEKARVYVDGYYAGVVDDYDGLFQRLRLEPGPHQITFRLEGYRTQHFNVYVPFGDTVRLQHDMVKGAGEATSDEYSGRPAGYLRMEDEPAEEPERE